VRIERAAHPSPAALQHMHVDHGRTDVLVPTVTLITTKAVMVAVVPPSIMVKCCSVWTVVFFIGVHQEMKV
jgi:hypothetical protein